LAELKEECAKAGRDFAKLDVTLMICLTGDRGQTQELLAQLAELGVNRVVQVSASEPLFEGDYRAKVENLVRIALP
jgi:hypothetical protein